MNKESNMTILDKLLEKKDVYAYIKFRIDEIRLQKNEVLTFTKDKEKQLIIERFDGRILELEQLKTTISQGKLKTKSKSYSRKLDKLNKKEIKL